MEPKSAEQKERVEDIKRNMKFQRQIGLTNNTTNL